MVQSALLRTSKVEFRVHSIALDLSPASKKVFLVHGRDDEAKHSVARFLTQIGLEPVILSEQPNRGKTIIEKFEQYADVGFAVVIITPDDLGAIKDKPENLQPRARQNVLLELGYFIGKLGRDRVCALQKGKIEIPTDFTGVLYTPMDDSEGWKTNLAREIHEAGIEFDLGKVVLG